MASLIVDGVPLSSLAFDVSTRSGWRSFPGIRATSITASNTDGVLVPSRRAPLEPGQLTVSMWVRGVDYADFTARVDTLMATFTTPRDTITVEMETDVGDWRVARARTVASWAVDHISPLHANIKVVLELVDGAWTAPEYSSATRTDFNVTEPLTVLCGDPTTTITDALLLIRDPGRAVSITIYDAAVSTVDAERIFARLDLEAPLASDRSLFFDLGQWKVGEVARPSSVTVEWFDFPPPLIVEHDVFRAGPMFGRTLLPLEPGSRPQPPRTPGVRIDIVDDDGIPVATREATLAVKPRWL